MTPFGFRSNAPSANAHYPLTNVSFPRTSHDNISRTFKPKIDQNLTSNKLYYYPLGNINTPGTGIQNINERGTPTLNNYKKASKAKCKTTDKSQVLSEIYSKEMPLKKYPKHISKSNPRNLQKPQVPPAVTSTKTMGANFGNSQLKHKINAKNRGKATTGCKSSLNEGYDLFHINIGSKKNTTLGTHFDMPRPNLNYSLEEARLAQAEHIQEMIGAGFRNKRKSNQVIRKKRLLFDKANNEPISTSDFLDTMINPKAAPDT